MNSARRASRARLRGETARRPAGCARTDLGSLRYAHAPRGRRKLSPGRRLVCDVVKLAAGVPSFGLIRDLDVRKLSEVRKQVRPKIAWTVILMKAYARVAARTPELRQQYVGFPWPQLYQHDRNVCMMAVSRSYGGEECLFFARFESPEQQSLLELHERYEYVRTAPVESIKQYRHQIRFAAVPWPLRWLGWWVMRNLWVRKAASHMGTFGLSISTFKDAYGTRHLSPNTSTLGVDLVSFGGVSRTLLTVDHRIMDGVPAVQVLSELGQELHGAILDELRQLAARGEPADTEQRRAA